MFLTCISNALKEDDVLFFDGIKKLLISNKVSKILTVNWIKLLREWRS